MTPAERTQKRIREREAAFQERTERQFDAFQDCYDLVCARALARAKKLQKTDSERYLQRSFKMLLGSGFDRRMVTQIYNHAEWLPEDCSRWLEQLGIEPPDVQWILKEVDKRRIRAAWDKIGGLKPGTRL